MIREMSIEAALHWAFALECASVEFDEMGETSGALRVGVDGIWLMMQRAQLGVRVDGGGRSDPAWDAEVIASTVTNLPASYGGRGMAVQVASLARAGRRADWVPDRPRCVPREWGAINRYGRFAKVERVGTEVLTVGGRERSYPVEACAVTYSPSAAHIAAARRNYLDWYGALLWIASELRSLDILSTIRITTDLPPLSPWRSENAVELQKAS